MDKFKGKYNIDELAISTKNKIVVSGWIVCNEEYELRVVIDSSETIITKESVKRIDVQEVMHLDNPMCGFREEIEFEDKNFKMVEVQVRYQGEWLTLCKKDTNVLMQESDFIIHHIDSTILQKDKVVVHGWAVSKFGEMPQIKLSRNKPYKLEIKERQDVYNAYRDIAEHNKIGFELIIEKPLSQVIEVEYQVNEYVVKEAINIGMLKRQRNKERWHKIVTLMKLANWSKIKKAIRYLRRNGLSGLNQKLSGVIKESEGYAKWIAQQLPTAEEIAEQRQHKFAYEPLISIVVPTYNTPKHFLIEMIDSVIKQSYSNWELCIADGNSQTEDTIKLLKEYMQKDKRIKVNFLSENYGISGNTNACLELATGEYVGLFDHDDLLTPNALYEVVKVLNEDRALDFIYSDEDKTDEYGQEFFDPHFKPDWSPDTLRSYNYICHFTVFRRNLLAKVGGFNKEFDGSQDYDLFLRLTEATDKIHHISKILYHWRVHRNSTAGSLSAKEYTVDAARRALQAHLNRQGIKGIIEPGLIIGTHRAKYEIEGNPKVSIIIPTKDHIDDLSQCIDSIKKSTYTNYEIVIIENNSTEEATFKYYEELKKEDNIKVVVWKEGFNYSAINNYGIKAAEGEYFILLNNDIEIITPNWIEEMLMHCQREEVGIVGAKLYYPDDTIQHAGVIIGIGGVAGHSHKYFAREDNGYFSRLKIIQNLSAVTAACLMVRRDVFESVNGLDEAFKVAFNDVDFCLRVREQNKLVIFTPYVEAYHHESKSRGAEDTPEKVERFNGEVQRFYSRWGEYRYDPYYNTNLTLENEDFGIKFKNTNYTRE